MGILEGKVAVITGGGQGIGEGLVYAFCHEGAKVVNIGRTFSKVERVVNKAKADGGDAIAVQCDIGDSAQVEAAIAKAVEVYGRIDVLVNNAMTQHIVPFEETTEQDMWDAYRNNVLGTFNCIKACLPYLKESKGRIINFGSGSGTHGSKGMTSYGTSKEAIRGMTKILAVELAKDGINVNVICPLAWTAKLEQFQQAYPDAFKANVKMPPMGHYANPETEIGRVCVQLAMPDFKYLSGDTLTLEGGMGLRP